MSAAKQWFCLRQTVGGPKQPGEVVEADRHGRMVRTEPRLTDCQSAVTVPLPALGIELPLSEIYAKVELLAGTGP